MTLEQIIRQYVRMPWEVSHGEESCRDRDIAAEVASVCRAGDYFMNEPEPQYRGPIVDMIAEVLTISLTKQTVDSDAAMKKFAELPDEQKNTIRNLLGISSWHTSILKICEIDELMPMLASYVAGAYALTTLTRPYVVDFDLLSAVAEHSKIGRSKEETEMRCAGLLIIKDLIPPSKSNIETYAFLRSLLKMRSQRRRMNLFLHPPVGNLQRIYLLGKVPTRLEVVEAYLAVLPAQLFIHNDFIGKHVHICTVDKYEQLKSAGGI